MRVMQFNRADLTEIEVENDATLKKLLPRAREAAAAEGAGTHVLDAALWQVVVQTTDVTLWSRVLRTFGFHVVGYRRPRTGLYGNVDITYANGGALQVYWIERATAPTGDLAIGNYDDDEPCFDVSHVNPVGEREREDVRASSPLHAAERYAALVFERYGTSHHEDRKPLAITVRDAAGSAHLFDVATDSTVFGSPATMEAA